MLFTTVALASLASLSAAQSLVLPAAAKTSSTLAAVQTISGSADFGGKTVDRGQKCNSDADTGTKNAVFLLKNGATLSNVVIGPNSLEGVHCEGSCTLKNVYFSDVCEGESSYFIRSSGSAC